MNLNSVSFALSQISYLVENLNKKNFKSSHQEILTVNIFHLFDVKNHQLSTLFCFVCLKLIDLHGFEAERHLYRCLVSSIDFNSDPKTSGKDFHQTQLLKECLLCSLNKPNFSTVFCFAFENSVHFQEVCDLFYFFG